MFKNVDWEKVKRVSLFVLTKIVIPLLALKGGAEGVMQVCAACG